MHQAAGSYVAQTMRQLTPHPLTPLPRTKSLQNGSTISIVSSLAHSQWPRLGVTWRVGQTTHDYALGRRSCQVPARSCWRHAGGQTRSSLPAVTWQSAIGRRPPRRMMMAMTMERRHWPDAQFNSLSSSSCKGTAVFIIKHHLALWYFDIFRIIAIPVKHRKTYITLLPGGCKVLWWILSVCLSTHISRKPQARLLTLCMLHVAVARFSFDNVTIRYVLPVLWITWDHVFTQCMNFVVHRVFLSEESLNLLLKLLHQLQGNFARWERSANTHRTSWVVHTPGAKSAICECPFTLNTFCTLLLFNWSYCSFN